MEGRGFSEFYRNTSEELFMKALMDGSVGMPMPTMEMGFKNLSQNFRADSEELFKSWLTNGENQGHNSASYRTRQASRRMSTELASLVNQNNGVILQKRSSENPTPQNTSLVEESLNDVNQHSVRSMAERGIPASNLYLAKAWFNSSQPMTTSRSSELRKRYAALQISQTAFGMEAMHNVSRHGQNSLKQEFGNPNGFINTSMSEIPNHFTSSMSSSNSTTLNLNTPQVGSVDKVSSVVSVLKGTLDRKKLTNQIENKAVEYSSLGYYCSQEGMGNPSLNQGQESRTYVAQGTFQGFSALQVNNPVVLQTVEGSIDIDLEEFVAPTNPVQTNTIPREPSQSESSADAPVVFIDFDACDGTSNSGQTQSNCESSRQQVGNGKNSQNGSRAEDIREQIYDNLKDDRQKGGLVRYGSVTSAGSVDRGDPTKKRRVERSRKMAEAKERVLTPAVPSDIQSILKRCENLEKEVRSLRLNLAFMNRKDSEQTKQIEELQKQNEELTEEKERLLEEIERIISETSKM